MDHSFNLRLTFWGVRGSTPTPRLDHLGFGGNTSCLEVRLPDNRLIILDAGTGLRDLGNSLMREFGPHGQRLHLFLTHYHWDHIQGIPFFAPLYMADNEVTFYSHRFSVGLADLMQQQMMEPFFPVEFSHLPAARPMREINTDPIDFDGVVVRPFRLNHPQGCMGYRIDGGGASIVYASDYEHGDPGYDAILREAAAGADILIYDAMYDVEEYASLRKGWGHSTWEEATRLAEEIGVKRLILFHHHPAYTDTRLEDIEQRARDAFERTECAREGSSLTV